MKKYKITDRPLWINEMNTTFRVKTPVFGSPIRRVNESKSPKIEALKIREFFNEILEDIDPSYMTKFIGKAIVVTIGPSLPSYNIFLEDGRHIADTKGDDIDSFLNTFALSENTSGLVYAMCGNVCVGYAIRYFQKNKRRMRAKMRVTHVLTPELPEGRDKQQSVYFEAVTNGTEEDNTYSKYTPYAMLTMLITNENLIDTFEVGDTFYLDFIKEEK